MRALLLALLWLGVLGAAFPVEVVDDRGQVILIPRGAPTLGGSGSSPVCGDPHGFESA